MINPFLANVPISYPLKTPESLWFPGVFSGRKMGNLTRNALMCFAVQIYIHVIECCSVVVPRVLFDFDLKKNYSVNDSFFHSSTVTSIDYRVSKILSFS